MTFTHAGTGAHSGSGISNISKKGKLSQDRVARLVVPAPQKAEVKGQPHEARSSQTVWRTHVKNFFVLFLKTGFLYCPGTCYVDQAGLGLQRPELKVCSTMPSEKERWNERREGEMQVENS